MQLSSILCTFNICCLNYLQSIKIVNSSRLNQIVNSASLNQIVNSARLNQIFNSARLNQIVNSACLNQIVNSARLNQIFNSARLNQIVNQIVNLNVAQLTIVAFIAVLTECVCLVLHFKFPVKIKKTNSAIYFDVFFLNLYYDDCVSTSYCTAWCHNYWRVT